jgi:hypothetical protein
VSFFARQFRKSPGEYGTFVIEESGLCTADESVRLEAGCTKRFTLEPLPQARGAIMKVLDGTTPYVVGVQPLTYTNVYRCVKIHAQVDPFAPAQEFGPYSGKAILAYTIRYQEVGGVV